VLAKLRTRVPAATVTLDWTAPLTARRYLLLFEALVSHQPGTDDNAHIRDAKLAIGKFWKGLREGFENGINEPNCFNLLGAALLRTGWPIDKDFLSRPCLVVRHKGTKNGR
jgi:hypothetical protein